MSGRGPGRLPKDGKERRKAEKDERKNDIDRIEVERFFSSFISWTRQMA